MLRPTSNIFTRLIIAADIHQGPWQTFKSNRITRDITFKANALSTFGIYIFRPLNFLVTTEPC